MPSWTLRAGEAWTSSSGPGMSSTWTILRPRLASWSVTGPVSWSTARHGQTRRIALDPELAMRRNGTSVGELAAACVGRGSAMLHISTNEVFDGRRADGMGYVERDEIWLLIPAYGTSKAAGERLAKDAFDRGGRLGPVVDRAHGMAVRAAGQ